DDRRLRLAPAWHHRSRRRFPRSVARTPARRSGQGSAKADHYPWPRIGQDAGSTEFHPIQEVLSPAEFVRSSLVERLSATPDSIRRSVAFARASASSRSRSPAKGCMIASESTLLVARVTSATVTCHPLSVCSIVPDKPRASRFNLAPATVGFCTLAAEEAGEAEAGVRFCDSLAAPVKQTLCAREFALARLTPVSHRLSSYGQVKPARRRRGHTC